MIAFIAGLMLGSTLGFIITAIIAGGNRTDGDE